MVYTHVMNMTRTQILLPRPLLDWLRKEANDRQISVSEFIRRIMDEARELREARAHWEQKDAP